jgi:hypothetical protein
LSLGEVVSEDTRVIRTGSLTRELLAEDPELVALLLDDYQHGGRREHCSRADFAAGWLALAKRMQLGAKLKADRKAVRSAA